MAKLQPKELDVKIHFKITFWEALKLRLAGKGAQKLVEALAKRIVEEKNEVY